MREEPLVSTPQSPASPAEVRRFARLRALLTDKRLRRRLLLVGALFALLVVAALSVLARLYTVFPLDVWVTLQLQDEESVAVVWLMTAVSAIGYAPWSTVVAVAGALIVGLFIGWRDGLYLLLITVVQGLINAGIKVGIGRPRPIDELVDVVVPARGFSFPSGHVMFYTVFFGFLLFLALTRAPSALGRWLLSIPLAALIALVGPSRIVLGAHWLSDVVAAYLLGIVLLALAIEGYARLKVAPRDQKASG
jgi:membrane-associated phospholipid phosphatase